MVETTRHIFQCGFRIMYEYTQSDEISLLFHPSDETSGRKLCKLNSILAGEASAKFSLLLRDVAVFDCRVSQLPQIEDVVDYFRWRSEDEHRNALNEHCYWRLDQQLNFLLLEWLDQRVVRYTWARNTFDRIIDLKLPARPGEK